MIKLSVENAKQFLSESELNKVSTKVVSSYTTLVNKTGLGNDYVGWLDLPNINKDELDKIKKCAKDIKSKCEVLVVVGIGGSYLGSAAVIAAHKKYFNDNNLEVIFAGHQISGQYLNELVDYLKDKEFCINVISKSGTTTEPAIAFRVLKELMEKRYGNDAKNRIYATTDAKKGALKQLADSLGYETFVVPDDVGGRFSVLTPVGLLPIACAGVDIEQLLKGAADAKTKYSNTNIETNDCLKYVLYRNALHNNGKDIEVLVNYEPKLNLFSEWWKQLYGESEGKDNKGIFVASVSFSTDLHSMGQMVQDGKRNLFETVIKVNKSVSDLKIPADKQDLDGLNFLAGKTFGFVNEQALNGTVLAHVDGKVPNLILELDELNPYTMGELIYFFELACGVSGYVLEVNPFDQPGVEAYKKNMFALLGKPGYEELKKELESKLK
ncbi:MAG: glucose-6-phosphate isomerase [bacterium]